MLKLRNGRLWLDPDRIAVVGLFGTLPVGPDGRPFTLEQFGDPVYRLPILGPDEKQLSSIDYEVPGGLAEPSCKPLSPITRRFVENCVLSANDTYSNQVGLGNTLFPNNTF